MSGLDGYEQQCVHSIFRLLADGEEDGLQLFRYKQYDVDKLTFENVAAEFPRFPYAMRVGCYADREGFPLTLSNFKEYGDWSGLGRIYRAAKRFLVKDKRPAVFIRVPVPGSSYGENLVFCEVGENPSLDTVTLEEVVIEECPVKVVRRLEFCRHLIHDVHWW